MKPDSGHFYTPSGEPAHFVEKKDGSGKRPTTVADARKYGYLPSPTTILKLLAKPALIDWLIRNAVHAVVTSPDHPNEGLDAKITRVLDEEKQQDQESRMAMDLGSSIHEAIELAIAGQPWNQALKAFVDPVMGELAHIGRCVASEKILVGRGFAGKTDWIGESDRFITICDFKTTKKLPERDAWPEAKLQVGAYCGALGNTGDKITAGMVIYISTTEPGKIKAFMVDDWQQEFRKFELLLKFWQLSNGIGLCV